nr:hypothetical protein [Ornithinicoccus halotolerans]
MLTGPGEERAGHAGHEGVGQRGPLLRRQLPPPAQLLGGAVVAPQQRRGERLPAVVGEHQAVHLPGHTHRLHGVLAQRRDEHADHLLQRARPRGGVALRPSVPGAVDRVAGLGLGDQLALG